MDEIFTTIADNDWDVINVEVDDNGNIIRDSFTHENDFRNYLENKLSKYDISYLGFELKEVDQKRYLIFKFAYASDMKILSTHYVKELANDIMLELTSEEIKEIKQTEGSIRKQFLKVLTIDTEQVEPMFYPSDEIHTYLRPDDEFHTNDEVAVLANAPTVEGDYITVVKVVK